MKEITEPGRNCYAVQEVERTGLLIDGRDYYRAFWSAARMAQRFILIAGWQFDSDVRLLRGKDATEAGEDAILLPFLDRLCRERPELEVYILAWDFSVLFALDREWFQDWIVRWTTSRRLHFRFDKRHAFGASHHQKLTVVDGQIAFVGGLDICSGRWDDRRHLSYVPDRADSNGKAYGPYHDVQSYHIGPAAMELARLFKERWIDSGGETLHLEPPGKAVDFPIEPTVAICADRVALSRTRAGTLLPLRRKVGEIRALYLDAIRLAEEMIYIENQYFSSRAVYGALKERLENKNAPSLQVVMVFPQRPENLLEEVSVYLTQLKMLRSLREIAMRTGNSLGIYFTSSGGEKELHTYVHSKVLLVDDRFLTVGSANTTNRSMGLDTELNVSWEARLPHQRDLTLSIRRARISLLAEHSGIEGFVPIRGFIDEKRLVDYLDALADQPLSRLHRYRGETFFADREWLRQLGLDDLSFDPETAVIEENILELISKDPSGFFAKGIILLNELLAKRGSSTASSSEPRYRVWSVLKGALLSPFRFTAVPMGPRGWTVAMLLGVALLLFLLLALGVIP
jgi:phospholipase D1/2